MSKRFAVSVACVIEAKAEVARAGAQQYNYFLGMRGELLQRMDVSRAR